ncbi:MAG TPA: hypothetical protein HA346_03245 [Thermoplasmata archaeon]|nr:hypothetical protein [Thermoplasmata archaeon]
MRKVTRYPGSIPHPYTGIRIPEILLTGILKSYKKHGVAGGFGLSFGRETAPEKVIKAPRGEYEITQGHTGTSIKKYLTMGSEAASEANASAEMEADHLIIVASSATAVKRIAGVYEESKISPEQLKKSIEYNKAEVDEAISTGVINAYTIDASDLFDLSVEKLTDKEIEDKFKKAFSENERKEMLSRCLDRKFSFYGTHNQHYEYSLDKSQIMRFSLKYIDSIRVTKQIYDYIKSKMKRPFGFEISLDETFEKTGEEELLFYLTEWKSIGGTLDFIAPNVGFKKRKDFRGNLDELEERVAKLAVIARSYGVLLSIHSGSGSSPYGGKGRGIYKALLKATEGKIKYKISGVYIELIFEILASYPAGSAERSLYEQIFDETYAYLLEQMEKGGKLASKLLREQLSRYKRAVEKNTRKPYDPRASFFRFNSYLALNFRDSKGRRYLRDKIVEFYQTNERFHEKVDREVEKLTSRLIGGLNFANNERFIKNSQVI